MKKTFLATSVSVLIVVVLAIVSFIRGPLEAWLLAAAFILWGASVLAATIIAGNTGGRLRRKAIKGKTGAAQQVEFYVPEVGGIAESRLLKHVNHRISGYLKSAWPEVTWEWCCKNPERLVAEGGNGRIRLFGIPDFNYATVSIGTDARIDFDMMRVVPLAQVNGQAPAQQTPAPAAQPVDVAVWFDLQGKELLESLIADLNSRGHSSLSIMENGDVCVRQADNDVPQGRLKNLPGKAYWPRIAKLLEKDELAATVTENYIEVVW